MIRYYVMFVSNGYLQLNMEKQDVTEWTDLDKAKAKYHKLCDTLWAEKTVITGYVAIIDNQFDIVEGYKEFIKHEQPSPEPVVSQPTEE